MITKTKKNSFALGETTSLMPHLHASPCERAHSVSLQIHHQSPWDFTQSKSKNNVLQCDTEKQAAQRYNKSFIGNLLIIYL